MAQENSYPQFKRFICLIAIASLSLWVSPSYAQDTTKSILDINNSKLIKKANQFLDTNQKKINNFLNNKIEKAKNVLTNKSNELIDKTGINDTNCIHYRNYRSGWFIFNTIKPLSCNLLCDLPVAQTCLLSIKFFNSSDFLIIFSAFFDTN